VELGPVPVRYMHCHNDFVREFPPKILNQTIIVVLHCAKRQHRKHKMQFTDHKTYKYYHCL